MNAIQRADALRYFLWLAVAETALENRNTYHMATTWFPHWVTNSLSLLVPDVLRVAIPEPQKARDPIPRVMALMVRDNPDYVRYVTPLALGYILSHPRFNIYKGRLGDIRVAGLGLDALPHASTAFGLVALAADTAERGVGLIPRGSPLYPMARWASRHPALFTGLVLGIVTFVWEFSEWRVHRHELKVQGGDVTKINMMWSAEDTARDVVANALGWLAAMLLRRRRNS